jgi:flavin-dependent dehydrogenase
MNGRRVLILGAGTAGLTCGRLLASRGWSVDIGCAPVKRGPMLLISDSNAALMVDLWEANDTLFTGTHPIRKRVVDWDVDAAQTIVVQPGVAMAAGDLAKRLTALATQAGLRLAASDKLDPAAYDWVVNADGRANAPPKTQLAFGTRRAIVVSVKLSPRARTERCVIEAVAGGWLFLIPHGLGRGTLQLVSMELGVDLPDTLGILLERGRTISPLVEAVSSDSISFDAMPRVCISPCEAGRIAIGEAALALDPLSGDGVGNALRTAILAAATLDAVVEGAALRDCLGHYEQRVHEAACCHVRNCLDYYRRARPALSWSAEIDAMTVALNRFGMNPEPFAFMLRNGRLTREATDVAIVT